MTYLLWALLAPVAGALLYRLLHRKGRAIRLVDTFVYLTVPVLVVLQVAPVAVRDRSLVVVLLLGLGILVPSVFERLSRALEAHTDRAALAVGLSGLALHVFLEGAALPTLGGGGVWVGTAIVLHRVPVGLVVWWLVRPRWGVGPAAWAVAGLVALTLGGYAAAEGLAPAWQGSGTEMYQAFVAGSLLHVVFHQGREDHAHEHPH